MTTVSNIATQILNENNYTTADISLTNLEYLIQNAIDYVNMEAGTNIADLSADVAGSKSITGTKSEIFTVKTLTVLLIRVYKDRGPTPTLQGLTVANIITDPQYSLFKELTDKMIARLCGMDFKK